MKSGYHAVTKTVGWLVIKMLGLRLIDGNQRGEWLVVNARTGEVFWTVKSEEEKYW